MATNTAKLGLTKPGYSDTADIQVLNDNFDDIDSALGGMSIIINGNKTAYSSGASIGQYVTLINSTIVDSGDVMLPDGVYTAAKAIPYNTAIDKSYLTAVAGGALNALNSKLTQGLEFVKSTTILTASLPNRQATKLCKVSLTPGKWLVYGRAVLQNTISGTRAIILSDTQSYFRWSNADNSGYGSGTDHEIALNGMRIIEPNVEKDYYLNAYQAVDGTQTVKAVYMIAIKLSM